MKHLVNSMKREIAKQYVAIVDQSKRVQISGDSYFKDTANINFFNIWFTNVQELACMHSAYNKLLIAYKEMCKAAGVEPVSVEEIMFDKQTKEEKKAARKAKKSTKKTQETAETPVNA